MKQEQDIRFSSAFERLFSPDELDALGKQSGFMKRRRHVTPQKFCMALVSALSDKHEQRRERPWAVSDAPSEYIDSMLRAIVGFALPISRIEGSFKLSQNKDAANFAGVRDGLAASSRESERQLAERMAQLP